MDSHIFLALADMPFDKFSVAFDELMSKENQWIQTISGRKFPLAEPDPEAIHLADIAHALRMLSRFHGQCLRFFPMRSIRFMFSTRLTLAMLFRD